MKSKPSLLTCRAVALNLLAQREHASHELAQKLAQRGFSNAEIDETLHLLQQQRLQSDERFSEMYTRHRAQRGYGPLRIQQELKQRGMSDELIMMALAQFETADWRQLAHRVHRKRFGDIPAKEHKERAAQLRFLLYRGFSSEIARKVVHFQVAPTI